ncbi:hypothetical protein FA15DRAFT_760162 [Coprinopsis marcescibilis]|uniref:Tail specific protease domain-containing protein n=1 Tax=Coprinopsis marcescibilis TaxID=230819 RepID=A0A5C3KGV1_COPMA|nr:hypothetical protein FA15DRAFT_760162 [Coprinopsis marcescibilis]
MHSCFARMKLFPSPGLGSLSTAGLILLRLSPVLSAPVAEDGPCNKLAGRSYAPPLDVLACYKSFPFNETIRQNVLTVLDRVFDFFSFENYYLDSPPPFEGSTVDIRANLARINSSVYETDYDFHKDIMEFTTSLNDGHTRYVPTCYTTYQSVIPTPITSLYDPTTSTHSIHIAPNSVELMTLMGDAFTSYYSSPEVDFDWKRLAGAKVLSIDNIDPYDYVSKIADTYTGNYLDHGVRVNLVYTSYRIAANTWSQRVGDLAGPIDATREDLPMRLIPIGATEPEDVRIPFYALFIGLPFTDHQNFWDTNCAVIESTNGVDFKDHFPLPDPDPEPSPEPTPSTDPSDPDPSPTPDSQRRPPRRHMKGSVLDPSLHISLDLPEPYLPTIPSSEGSQFVFKNYLLPDNVTGVMYVGSFGGNFDQFQLDVYLAVESLKNMGAKRLLIDTSNNGGGYICLGQYLWAYLSASTAYPGFDSTNRAHPLAEKILSGMIGFGLDYGWSYYAADNWAFVNGTRMNKKFNYLTNPVTDTVNGQPEVTSLRLHETCHNAFVVDRPKTPPFDLSQVAIVGNGACGSTCALFTTLMRETHNTKVAVVGGKPGEPIEYKGMAGNQVLEWWDLDSELKTSGAKADPLAPPDLLVRADFRHNWRIAYSRLEPEKPVAYRSDPATHRFYYTKDTFANPQNLWIEAAKLLFDTDSE